MRILVSVGLSLYIERKVAFLVWGKISKQAAKSGTSPEPKVPGHPHNWTGDQVAC